MWKKKKIPRRRGSVRLSLLSSGSSPFASSIQIEKSNIRSIQNKSQIPPKIQISIRVQPCCMRFHEKSAMFFIFFFFLLRPPPVTCIAYLLALINIFTRPKRLHPCAGSCCCLQLQGNYCFGCCYSQIPRSRYAHHTQ